MENKSSFSKSGQTIFPLSGDDQVFVRSLSETIRQVLSRPDVSPQQINKLSKLLLGLERLPLPTPGLDIELYATLKGEGESESYHILLREKEFLVDSGGFISAGFGTDSFSGFLFNVEIPSCRIVEGGFDAHKWIETFRYFVSNGELHITDDSDDRQLDWTGNVGGEIWLSIE